MSSDTIILKFTVSNRSRKIMLGFLGVATIVAIFSGIMYAGVTNAEPELEAYNFTINDDETIFLELTVNEGETIYYKFQSDEFMDVRLMTHEEYTDMQNEGVYSYIEDDYTAELDKKTEPLEAGTYVFYLKGDYDNTSGTLSYGIDTDISGKGMFWLGMIPISLFSGILLFIIYGSIADAIYVKKGN